MLHHKSLNFYQTTRRQSHEDIFQAVFFDASSPPKTRIDWPSVTVSNPSWHSWKILFPVSNTTVVGPQGARSDETVGMSNCHKLLFLSVVHFCAFYDYDYVLI